MSTRKKPKAIGSHMDVLLGSAATEPAPVARRGRGRKRTPPPTRRLSTYRLPMDLVVKVDAICRVQGTPRGATVAAALQDYIARWEAKAAPDVLRLYQALLAQPAGSSSG